jgi:hypothetical protein
MGLNNKTTVQYTFAMGEANEATSAHSFAMGK